MAGNIFDSLNPYESMECLYGKTPEQLLEKIKAIDTPVKIVSMFAHNNRFYAYIMGDIRTNQKKKVSK